MEFNKSLLNSKLDQIDAKNITHIYLVYTKYKKSEEFNQMLLNQQRISALYKKYPKLNLNKNIKWHLVSQTGCNLPEGCADYYHGFVVQYRNSSMEFSSDVELHTLDYYVDLYSGKASEKAKLLDSLIETGKTTLIKKCDSVEVKIYLPKIKKGKILFVSNLGTRKVKRKLSRYLRNTKPDEIYISKSESGELEIKDEGIPLKAKEFLLNNYKFKPYRSGKKVYETHFTFKLDWGKRRIDNIVRNTIPFINKREFINWTDKVKMEKKVVCNYLDTAKPEISGSEKPSVIYSNTVNKVVLEVFDRNKHWKNCLIATDVTGSMTPYMAQFLVWHALNAKVSPSHKDFVFFNDGDNANDLTKKMGKVGGVYYINTSSHKKVEKVLKEAKRKGGGGDAPENNVEATIKGLKRNPSVQGVIMIADNQATPRDLELLRKVKKPIHVILCGASTKINIDYLNMA